MNFCKTFFKRLFIFTVIDFIASLILFFSFIVLANIGSHMLDLIPFIRNIAFFTVTDRWGLAVGGTIALIIGLTILCAKICYKKGYTHIWFLPVSHLATFIISGIFIGDGISMPLIMLQFTAFRIGPSLTAAIIYSILVKKKKI